MSVAHAQKQKAIENIVTPITEINGSQILTGMTATEANGLFVVLIASWVIREAWAWFKEKANKTGEKISRMDTKLEKLETKIDAFINAIERSEDRMDKRVARIEHLMDKR